MVELMIVALELAAQCLREALRGCAGQALIAIRRRMDPIADAAGKRDVGVRGHRLDPALGAVLLDPEIGRDMVLPDDEALLAKAGEEIELEEP